MEEYEYSIKVKNIEPYIEYCENNNYTNKSITNENRIVYHNDNLKHVIARLTINENDTILDFKNINKEENDLKISNESLPMIVNNNMDVIKSMLNVLGFYENANNERTRYIYEKDDVIFEIDNYIKPKMCVVAIEGNKNKVDMIYKEIKETIGSS